METEERRFSSLKELPDRRNELSINANLLGKMEESVPWLRCMLIKDFAMRVQPKQEAADHTFQISSSINLRGAVAKFLEGNRPSWIPDTVFFS